MANIARLGVVLGLNTAEFQTGVAGAMKSTEGLKKGFLAIGASAVAAATSLGYLVKQSINNMDALAKQAQMAGVTVESLSGLAYAADLAGVNQETLTSSLARLTKGMSEAAQGTGEALKAFEALKIDTNNLGDADAVLLQLAEKFQGFEDGAQKTALAIALFGRAGAQLIPFLNSGRDGIEELRKEAALLGIVIGTDTAKAAETFNDSLTRLNAIQKGFINRITEAVLPSLNALTQSFFDAYVRSDELRFEMAKLTSNNVPGWASKVGYAFALTADGIVNTVKAVIGFVQILGLAVDGVDLLAANYVKILAISKGANEQAAINLSEARAKFDASAQGISDTFSNLTKNAFTFTDAFKTSMMAVQFPDFDTGFYSAEITPKIKAPQMQKVDDKKDKMDNMLAQAKLLSAEYERERLHSLDMQRIRGQMAGLTENERRVQERVNEVLDATSKKLQEIADKREAAAGRDASAEVIAEYDKQSAAIQAMSDKYVKAAKDQEEATIASQRTFSYGWDTAFAQFAEDSENYATMAADMFSVMTGSMNAAIDNFVENGKFAFGEFAASVIKDLIKIELKMQASQLLKAGIGFVTSAIGMYSGGGFGTGNSFGNQDIGGFLAEGGPASGNTPYIVGERGPELFVPSRSGVVIPNHDLGSMSGGGGVTYNGPVIQNMSAIDTQSGLQFLAKNKMNIYALNQSAGRSMPTSR